MRSYPASTGRVDVNEGNPKDGLPNISELLRDLNEMRKHQSYGDVDAPELSAEEIAAEVEAYVGAVAALVGKAAKRS